MSRFPTISPMSVETLNRILEKHSKSKITRHTNQKIYRVTDIKSVSLKQCNYVGNTPNPEPKTHLQIKFTSPDEFGLICMSILIDKYFEWIDWNHNNKNNNNRKHKLPPVTITNHYIL